MAEPPPARQSAENAPAEVDEIWASSRTARQIHALGEVEKTDAPDSTLPKGDERSEQFVDEVTEYFRRLDNIQDAIRGSLAHIRRSRIAPSAINAPPPGFIPPALGVGLPKPSSDVDGQSSTTDIHSHDRYNHAKLRGLQEERVERNAWKGILDALMCLRDARDAGTAKENE
ncbi:hypothetical protein K488DRAFT_43962 [Vararia minispora EC-137]|uniref:Uncharacterized protein n=1 Tax=Vararia minispora EC-137 TaxID=1314806 RepID=A0ACB8QUS8_9AGAM|nr:hypothetical protein K488DRAFT_43962 [Vararia minispora EC-137]